MKNGEEELLGGLIYHGNHDVSRSFQIESSIGWEIHT
jgi:hypothetical protein